MTTTIEKTPCYPNSYKVVAVGCRPDNASYLFFPTRKKAEEHIEEKRK